jgi:small-conductance mechanosensitive channel
VLALTSVDVDQLAGETVEGTAAAAVDRIRVALAETVEARTPRVLLVGAAVAVAVVILGLLLLWGVHRAHRYAATKFVAVAEETVARSGIADVASVRASRLLDVERWLLATVALVLEIAIVYGMVAIVLRQFPYTRAWGESMRSFLVTTVENLLLGAADAIPGLITVVIIFFVMRFVVRLITLYFNAVEQGRVTPRWIHPETAQPTRRLLTGLVWMFAIVVAYPYLPGSQTEAFKGISVFLGLVFTLGSSGLVNQIMSSFMITYSRALRVGNFVRIGEVEGTVTHLGMLSTKVRTPWREEVTIPNTVVVATQTTDYSRLGDIEGTYAPTSVTIGYDAPWRQVQSLLLMAAERTAGLRREPAPMVLQMGLEDFYVKYTLFVCLERQETRPYTLHALHANIQDLFNEYGVQIMSPNYVFDPAARKVVEKKDWFAAPARVEGDGAESV